MDPVGKPGVVDSGVTSSGFRGLGGAVDHDRIPGRVVSIWGINEERPDMLPVLLGEDREPVQLSGLPLFDAVPKRTPPMSVKRYRL